MFSGKLFASLFLLSGLSYGSVVANTGGINLGYANGYGSANFGGPDFHVTGLFEWGPPAFVSGILNSTTTVPVSGFSNLFTGTLTYFGSSYSIPNQVSDTTGSIVNWSVTGTPIAINGPGTYTTAVNGSGTLRRRVSLNPSAPFDVDDTWAATGIATITVEVTIPPSAFDTALPTTYRVTSQTYDFTATPEPGAWGLMAGALLCGVVALRQRRRMRS